MTAISIIIRFIFIVYGLWQILRTIRYVQIGMKSEYIFAKAFWITLASFIVYYAGDIAEWICR